MTAAAVVQSRLHEPCSVNNYLASFYVRQSFVYGPHEILATPVKVSKSKPLLKASVERAPDVEVELNGRQIVLVDESISDAHRVLFHRVSVRRPTLTIVRPKLQQNTAP